MPARIEDYGLIGDGQAAALVSRDGSIDWLCLPRFDSPACFAALLGTPENGRWRIAPAAPVRSVRRRYREDTLVLETDYETEAGSVTLVDFMPRGRHSRTSSASSWGAAAGCRCAPTSPYASTTDGSCPGFGARTVGSWLSEAPRCYTSGAYGLAGERRLPELELDWLPGFEGSRPVRIGNGAHGQLQIDVFGEVADVLHLCRRKGLQPTRDGWRLEGGLLEYLESRREETDEGIWEVRGPRRHFTHSKMMAWVALDRAVKDAEGYGLEAPLDRWRALRDRIHAEVCARAYDAERGAFVMHYGGEELDASLLMMPLVGFLPPADPRVRGTVAAIERELLHDGLVRRYRQAPFVDGVPGGEGTFLLCSFWLADNYVMLGRHGEARRLFERLLGLRNDLGLLSEEYDPAAGRMLGNFPQAFSHVGLVNTARNLTLRGPAADRPGARTGP